MTVRVAISGLGRIGRLALRAATEKNNPIDVDIVAVNFTAPPETLLHLLKYDSAHGVWDVPITFEQDTLVIGAHRIKAFRCSDPAEIPWHTAGVDVVMECSGKFRTRDSAAAHLIGKAGRVLVSAPTKQADLTVVYGVNHQDLRADHTVVSNASCTTNCLAPVAKSLDDAVGIVRGYMTTVHSYTGDQRVLDATHKDLYRARAAAVSIIPTTTGAAESVGDVLPHLKGKLHGSALRVPTPNVSLIDFTFEARTPTSADQINEIMKRAAEDAAGMQVLAYSTDPCVSIDFNHNPYSAIFDANGTSVADGTFVRVMAWYDNEWAYSRRMCDVARAMALTV